jgi:tetratricopeptide (TPR) repeat protein
VLYWKSRALALPFHERDWALITQFDNRTGETLFDGSVEYALERELVNSQFVNVVPRERAADALRLMMKPPETRIDREIGREICLRDGGIRALIAGRIEKIGGTYLVSADVVDPASGATVRSFSQEAAGQQEVVRAIRKLSDRLRQGLGEELSATRPAAGRTGHLEPVSTPSLRALQLYSQGDGLLREHKPQEAAAVLREAIREDPEFASAHVLLAHVLANLGRDAEAAPHFQRALALAERTTERERLFILSSSYEKYHGDSEKAAETLEILLRLYPDHYWAATNLASAYVSNPRRALPYTVRRADLRPNNFDHQLRAAHTLVLWGDAGVAGEYAERARRLIAAERDDPVRSWRAAWVRLYPAHVHWVKGNLQAALAEVTKIASELEAMPPEERRPLQWEIGSFYLTLGRERDARQMFGGVAGEGDNLALVALGVGDDGWMRQQLLLAPASHRSAILFARAGKPAEGEKALAHPDAARRAYAPFLAGVWNLLARGEISLARGDRRQAIPLLERSSEALRGWPTSYFFLGVESLSRALEQDGDIARSITILEETSQYGRASVFWGPAPIFWMQNELRRADLYRRAGREADARRVEARLAKLLEQADDDFVILRELTRRGAARQHADVTVPSTPMLEAGE